jgi:hypothetical protein
MRTIIDPQRLEIEMSLQIHRIVDYKRRIREILDRYQIAEPEEIKRKIEKGLIEAHPAYEDYLDAVSYRMEINDLLERLEKHLIDLKELG